MVAWLQAKCSMLNDVKRPIASEPGATTPMILERFKMRTLGRPCIHVQRLMNLEHTGWLVNGMNDKKQTLIVK